jgi:hypothetical protein
MRDQTRGNGIITAASSVAQNGSPQHSCLSTAFTQAEIAGEK